MRTAFSLGVCPPHRAQAHCRQDNRNNHVGDYSGVKDIPDNFPECEHYRDPTDAA